MNNIAETIARGATDLFEDMVVPAIKNTIVDTVMSGISQAFWGESVGGFDTYRRGYRQHATHLRRRNRPRIVDRRRYDEDYHRRRTDRRKKDRRFNQRRSQRDLQNKRVGRSAFSKGIYFQTREDAELTLARMIDFIAESDWITLGDFYGLVGIEGDPSTERIGWEDLSQAYVYNTRSGYLINLEDPERE